MTERIVSFGGSAVRITAEDTAALELLNFLFGAIPDDPAADPHRHFFLRSDSNGQNFNLTCSDLPEESSGSAGTVGAFLMERVCYHLADRCTAGLLFHGACLVKNGQAIMLPGRSGSGKSTLALFLARQRGWGFLSDELTLFDPSSGLCTGFTRPIHLKTAAARLFPDLKDEDFLPVTGAGGRSPARLVAVQAAHPAAQGMLPLAAIIRPQYKAGVSASQELLTPADAALHLTTCLINARNLPGHGFADIARLVQAIPAYHLIYDNHSSLPELELLFA